VADVLAGWAIRHETRRVLDPSFGDGALLRAAEKRLRALRVGRPAERLFGLELDPTGPDRAARAGLRVLSDHLRTGDFFAATVEDFANRPFEAIIGNPPYVRHHLLDAAIKRRAQDRAREAGIDLSERADAWAYFCAHLIGFLAPAGRLALLLPGSVLHADYALPVVHAFAAGSGHSTLIRVQRHLFPDVLERTVVLLLDRGVAGAGQVEYREVPDLDGLRLFLEADRDHRRRRRRSQVAAPAATDQRLATRVRWHLRADDSKLFSELAAHPQVLTVGDLATVRIGVVTGANRWFVRTASEAKRLRAASVPVLSRSASLSGPIWTAADHDALGTRPSRLLALAADQRQGKALRDAIKRGMDDGLPSRHHCGQRDVWWSLADTRAPDLFLPYMGASAPRLVLNRANATCTNAIHRVTIAGRNEGTGASGATMVLGSWTSLWRLSVELVGRSYGGGVLKLEPGEAVRVHVPLVLERAGDALRELDALVRRDGRDAGRRFADRLVLQDGLGIRPAEIRRLHAAAERLERRRAG
jgi:adenine-specific DNA-methyltransferase